MSFQILQFGMRTGLDFKSAQFDHIRGETEDTIPYHTIPYHTIPYHTIPYHTIPYHTIPHLTIPYHTILHHTIPYHGNKKYQRNETCVTLADYLFKFQEKLCRITWPLFCSDFCRFFPVIETQRQLYEHTSMHLF